MKKSAVRLCRRVDCRNSVNGKAAYCSRRCSAWVRNHRYYGTLNGRLHKRAAARRYFQRHHQELYDRRAARFEDYVNEILNTHNSLYLHDFSFDTPGAAGKSLEELSLIGARYLARVQHDWNPRRQGDSSIGRPYYMPNEKGTLVPGIFHSDAGWRPVGSPVDISRFVKPSHAARKLAALARGAGVQV
jgi:hypothetical protein